MRVRNVACTHGSMALAACQLCRANTVQKICVSVCGYRIITRIITCQLCRANTVQKLRVSVCGYRIITRIITHIMPRIMTCIIYFTGGYGTMARVTLSEMLCECSFNPFFSRIHAGIGDVKAKQRFTESSTKEPRCHVLT